MPLSVLSEPWCLGNVAAVSLAISGMALLRRLDGAVGLCRVCAQQQLRVLPYTAAMAPLGTLGRDKTERAPSLKRLNQ